MADINKTSTEVCRDLHENTDGGCCYTQEKNLQKVILMIEPSESTKTLVPCKPAHPRLSSSGPVCRICHEDDSSENLISPCECTGTLGLVHRNCLEKWLSASNTTECEICKYQFNTSRYPRPMWQWFKSHRGLDCHQGLYGDVLCLLILTPPCLISIYLCGMGSAMYMKHGLWEALGLAMLCCFLLATFVLWVGITVRFHWNMLRNWQRMNQIIRLKDLQHCHHTNSRLERSEVNNNGHLEQRNTSV
ncbi:E3 ubiquitin-protein ligase MARCH2-like isoform X2 [Zootermopsis nevadensis]|uniref:E3 ubiquitin-protein ligase MARCH2 n=2 Tax=Zootermopsis nevadensis TaxID=136037 RepID=A0A067RGT3_ZOONE|nr:E3 ubiquitin-protein ligase MARCH2-like isoform X2 [Zootermopsis nevadensis]XP_021914252.1 E3 ubiquitin-protein ligase MARCH2-like isoform X2 [Zootermopsis nevadensis]XP_021914253.1 E3 ubiquitin-protein ligase MARCH2-like isoform X2 [Zootermopsis nevadensis]XP_021914254.1 E3 ubiquitin-protein ligase MARCH2-like isoform X2 [Zootermopsis nevadensis]KDR22223.1 E3 ubiquitin-protein ligase MARCH2 [Zootermopsis nevadensis]